MVLLAGWCLDLRIRNCSPRMLILDTVLLAGLGQGLENREDKHGEVVAVPLGLGVAPFLATPVSTLQFVSQISLCRKKVASRSCHFYNNVEGKTNFLKLFLVAVVQCGEACAVF